MDRHHHYYRDTSNSHDNHRHRGRSRSPDKRRGDGHGHRDYREHRGDHRQHRQYRDYDYSRHGRRSRSRSRDRERERKTPSVDSGTYEERGVEQMQQKIRLAIRDNSIQFDPQLHETYMSLPESKQQQLADQAMSSQKIHQCILVRELFISGLNEMTENSIREIMGKYGEIQTIEILKNFAFVKYYKVEDASNACADYHNINTTLHPVHNNNFKIFFADHLKRWNVVSNHPNHEDKQLILPVIYASVKNDAQFCNQRYLYGIFNTYGFIRNFFIRKNQLPGPKIYVLIQYETLTQAYRAREKLRFQKDRLGDRRSEITLLVDTDKLTKLCPNVNNQLRYQRKRQQNANNFTSMNSLGNINEPYTNGTTGGLHQTSDIYAILKQYAQKQEAEHQEQSDWVGFFTRNKQFRVQVDFTRIHKNVVFDLQSILNVSHRGSILQVLARTDYVLAGKFKAVNTLNADAFAEYIKYFENKNRAGIIFTKAYMIYLIPPVQELNLPYQLDSNQLLALFFKIPEP